MVPDMKIKTALNPIEKRIKLQLRFFNTNLYFYAIRNRRTFSNLEDAHWFSLGNMPEELPVKRSIARWIIN
jgi:hypothetical protein